MRSHSFTSALCREGNSSADLRWGFKAPAQLLCPRSHRVLASRHPVGGFVSIYFHHSYGFCRTVYMDSFSSPGPLKYGDLGSRVGPSLSWPSPWWYFILTHIFNFLPQWLVKRAIETKEEMGDYIRSYSISQFQKTYSLPEVSFLLFLSAKTMSVYVEPPWE